MNLRLDTKILKLWPKLVDHYKPASLSYINKAEITDSEALDIMEKLSVFPKSYNALQVVLFSCSDDVELVDEKYESIVAKWKSAT